MTEDHALSDSTGPTARGDGTRAGYVTLVGRPNAGKSTLMNAFVETHLSIVTPKAQTTWERVTGILTTDSAQMIFLDTPGLLEARSLFHRSMLGAALTAVEEADVVLVVVDAAHERPERTGETVIEAVGHSDAPAFVAVNKIDRATEAAVNAWAAWAREALDAVPMPVSATEGMGVTELRDAVAEALPDSPFLYPPDDLAIQPVRFFVAELVRETIFEQYREEIPYATVARVVEFREDQEPVYIGIEIHVERESQKGIVVGRKGRAIRELGQEARRRIEHFLGRPVYLDLWVKTLRGWRRKSGHLARLGYRVPEESDERKT